MQRDILSDFGMCLFIVRQELSEGWSVFFRNKQDKKYFDFNQKCIFSLKKIHILTVSTLQNLSISLHHMSILVYLFTAKTRGYFLRNTALEEVLLSSTTFI